ncbi:hypothetical protein SAMN05421820_11523 [Pedobacter steynii]|uniref:Uncharacterized protein n=1 Tax=Pedobacter steynii TaxID=430522 RepID=A0A1H0JNF4_9SPHI|nr:DUF6304 family protein [Pedobacter steynii]NQX43114.1 hypothetical protein [Pedobacter steynii]SDO45072.1 hypothetical protein SAMN05421820_11523 [Pedobacter steynii]
MIKQQKYRGTFTDDFGTNDIDILNDFENLYFEIDGVKFEGLEFGDFEILNKKDYSDQQLERFTFSAAAICNYKMTIFIPQVIIDNVENRTFTTNLILEYDLGKPKLPRGFDLKLRLNVIIDGQIFEGFSDYDISYAFDQILEQFGDQYKLKNCYGCLYSDYSPYGQKGFGGLYCFVRQKEKYLSVEIPKDSYKFDYFEKCENDYDIVQETFCCDKYEIRKQGTGYRG